MMLDDRDMGILMGPNLLASIILLHIKPKKDAINYHDGWLGAAGSLNAFFFLFIGVISQSLIKVRKKGEQAHLESAVQRRVVCLSSLLKKAMHPLFEWFFYLGIEGG